MNKQLSNPSELARETLNTLATRKIPPTPNSYAKIYAEISGLATEENNDAEKVLRGIADCLVQIPQSAPASIALKKLIGSEDWGQCEALFEKLSGLMRSWSDSTATTDNTIEINSVTAITSAVAPPAAINALVAPAQKLGSNVEIIVQLAELLAQTLESILGSQPELIQEIQTLVQQVRNIKTHEQINMLAHPLRQFWIKAELRGGDKAKIHEGLIRLLRLLVANVAEMVEGAEWLHGQITILQEIIAHPTDKRAIADAERNLRDAIIKQDTLKQGVTDAKKTLKSLMVTFIDQLGEITDSTSDDQQKIEGYSLPINQSSNIAELSYLLNDIMQDTRLIQASALRSHDELLGSRNLMQEAERKIQKLEQALAQVSELVQEDQLTGTLNRRGLDDAFAREATRADRSLSPLCVALLDIDNFKSLNDSFGHQAGDQALVHLSGVIQDSLRLSDTVSRYGGEEFILLLPEVELKDAVATIERLQRELAKKCFQHNNERVVVTFSAGVTLRSPEETQKDVLGRADKAMYQAKKAGKNRVVIAK